MASFYEFLTDSSEPEKIALPGPGTPGSLAEAYDNVKQGVTKLALSIDAIPNTDAEKFGQDVAKLVTSDIFLKELSEEVRMPRFGETEDEFVSRCKQTLFGLMDKHLAKT